MVYNRILVTLGPFTKVTGPTVSYQYDQRQILVISGVTLPEYYEVDICNEGDTTTVTMVGTADGVLIPNAFLRTGRKVKAYVVLQGQDPGAVETRYEITLPVYVRPAREDIDPTAAEQQQIDSLIGALNDGVSRAETAAEAAEQAETDVGEFVERAENAASNAETSASNASSSATNAANSASTATTKASQAASSAQSASQNASAANASAGSAAQSASFASESASASAGSASRAASAANAASESAGQAASSASSASGSASQAAGSAQSASGSAASASQSATNAANSASEASTQAGNAATKAGEAASSATAAGNAQSAAETAQGKAEDAQEAAETAAQSIASAAAQIAQNAQDISDAKNAITDFVPTPTWTDGYISTLGELRQSTNYQYSSPIEINYGRIVVELTDDTIVSVVARYNESDGTYTSLLAGDGINYHKQYIYDVTEPGQYVISYRKANGISGLRVVVSPKLNSLPLDVLNAIGQKQDAPETEGTAGQVLGLDSNLAPVWVDQSGGGGGGTTNYNRLTNKPQINGVELTGNKSTSELNIDAGCISFNPEEDYDEGTVGAELSQQKNAIDQKQDATNYVTLSGTIVTQTGADNTMYLCGELAELTFTAPQTGITAVRFTSGTTPTVVTLNGVTMPDDWNGAEASTTYEINVLNGLGVWQSWI